MKENKLIAEFMGMKPFENPFRGITKEDGLYERFNQDGTTDIVGDLNYKTSWDWLMPVVEKIERMGCVVEISLCLGKLCRITKGNFKTPIVTIANIESNDTIEAIWLAVVQYVKWYNEQQKPVA